MAMQGMTVESTRQGTRDWKTDAVSSMLRALGIRRRGPRLSDGQRLALSVALGALALLAALVLSLTLLAAWSKTSPTDEKVGPVRVSLVASDGCALGITSQQEVSYAP